MKPKLMKTKAKLIEEIEKLAKDMVGKVWKVNPLNFYRGYKYRTMAQLYVLRDDLLEQAENYRKRK